MEQKLEKMDEFFARRVEGYDEHMLGEVPGCRAAYRKIAQLVPDGCQTLLDLGCGTGLELESLYGRFPALCVTGIDMTPQMLERLIEKYRTRTFELICGDYFEVPFGKARFDAAVSFQTMHHFTADRKLWLYRKIREALKPGGVYVECDYMVACRKDEEIFFSESRRLRREQGLAEDAYFHYDTPLTVRHQMKLFREAGFADVRNVYRMENTTILTGKAG